MTEMTEEKKIKGNFPNLRFPEFEGEWELFPITKFLELKNGLNTSSENFGKGIKFISVMDILNNQYITYDNIIGNVNIDANTQERYAVKYGDILFQRSSETMDDVGRSNVYLDKKTAVFGGFVIRGKKIGNYDPFFFKLLLDSPNTRKKIIAKGAGSQRYNIGQDGLSEIYLFFPRIQEQEKISSFLSLIENRIETQIKIIEKYESLIKGISDLLLHSKNYLFRRTPLGSLCSIKKGEQVNSLELTDTGFYYVMNGGMLPSGYYFNYNTNADTISISEGGNSCGYVQYNYSKFWSGGHCYTLNEISKQIFNKYLYYYLKSQEKTIQALRVGSGLPNIQKKDLERFEIQFPNYEEQKKAVKILTSFSRKIEIEYSLLSVFQKQKSYFLQQMFI